MSYCLTPQSTTGVSPAELLLGRQLRSRLDLLKPNKTDRVEAIDSTANRRVTMPLLRTANSW